MPKRLPEFFVIDILVSIEIVKNFISKTREATDFVADEAIFNGVLRELEIIGEATNNLLKAKELEAFVKPTWREVADFRNLISHEYFGLDYEEIFDIVVNELPIFEQEIKDLAMQLKNSPNLSDALQRTREDLRKIRRLRSVRYLDEIERWLNEKKF